jgi:hypothetical protein
MTILITVISERRMMMTIFHHWAPYSKTLNVEG